MIHFLCCIFQCAQIGSDAGTNVLVPGVVQKFHRSCLKVKKFLIVLRHILHQEIFSGKQFLCHLFQQSGLTGTVRSHNADFLGSSDSK